MKQLKKLMVMILCVGVLGGLTACGNSDDADNGAVNNETTDNAGGTGTNGDNMNGATNGTDGTVNKNDTVGGALEEGADWMETIIAIQIRTQIIIARAYSKIDVISEYWE